MLAPLLDSWIAVSTSMALSMPWVLLYRLPRCPLMMASYWMYLLALQLLMRSSCRYVTISALGSMTSYASTGLGTYTGSVTVTEPVCLQPLSSVMNRHLTATSNVLGVR